MEVKANRREAPFTHGSNDALSPRTQHSLPPSGKPNTIARLQRCGNPVSPRLVIRERPQCRNAIRPQHPIPRMPRYVKAG